MTRAPIAAIRIGDCGELFLTDIPTDIPTSTSPPPPAATPASPAVHVFERYRQTPDHLQHPVLHARRHRPHARLRRWSLRNGEPCPMPQKAGLLAALTELRPTTVFVIVPTTHSHDLPGSQQLDLEDVEDVLLHPEIKHSVRVVVLLDRPEVERGLTDFATTLAAARAFYGESARLVFAEHVRRVSVAARQPPRPLWSGPIVLHGDDGETVTRRGFEICADTREEASFWRDREGPLLTDAQVAAIQGVPARLVATESPGLPTYGVFLGARGSLELKLALDCPDETGSFCNEWVNNGGSVLLLIGPVKFWCFWTRRISGMHVSWVCRALVIPELAPAVADALDVAAFRRERLGNKVSGISPVPDLVAQLPDFSLGSQGGRASTDMEGSEEGHMDKSEAFKSAVEVLAKRKRGAAFEDAELARTRVKKRVRALGAVLSKYPLPLEGISHPDRELLQAQSLGCKHAEERPVPVTADMNVENDRSTAEIERSGRAGVAPACARRLSFLQQTKFPEKSNLTMRQHRFARLQSLKGKQSLAREKAGERKSNVRPMPPHKKRIRSKYEANRKQEASRSGMAYIERAGRTVLKALERSPPFFSFSVDKGAAGEEHCPIDKQWRCVGAENEFRHTRSDQFEARVVSGSEFPNRGTHGIEYAQDGDGRDEKIMKFEQMLGKSGFDFSSSQVKDRRDAVSKLQNAVNQLKTAGAERQAAGFSHLHGDAQHCRDTANPQEKDCLLDPQTQNKDSPDARDSVASTQNDLPSTPLDPATLTQKTIEAVRNGLLKKEDCVALMQTIIKTM